MIMADPANPASIMGVPVSWHPDTGHWYDFLSGGTKYNPDPNAAKLGDRAGQVTGYDQQGLNNLTIGGAFNPAQFNSAGSDQWRGQQQALAGQLNAVASGHQQGAGELAVQRQIGNAMAAQQSTANSARGANSALAGLQSARSQADLGLAGAGQSQQAALQDQSAARQQLAGVLGQGRGQDIQSAMGQLQAQGMNQQQALAYLSQMTGMDQAEMQARMQQEAIQAGSYQPGMIGQAFSAAGGLMTGAGALGWKPLAPSPGGG
jgi:hypothetical protein